MNGFTAAYCLVALAGWTYAWRGYWRRWRELRALQESGTNGLLLMIAKGYLVQRRIFLAIQSLKLVAGVAALLLSHRQSRRVIELALFGSSVLTALSAYLADRYARERSDYAAEHGHKEVPG